MTSATNVTALGVHEGRENSLCACGACAHHLRVLLVQFGVPVAALKSTLRVQQPPAGAPAGPVRHARSIGDVADRAIVTVAGRQHTGTDASLATIRVLM